MSMLNFKHGLYANLPSAINNGTIYVTTDEKAMYVDLNDTRIRLSQIITLSTYDWQNLTPPYSTEAFYYISDANALLKYTGSQWMQLNSTAEIENSLAALGFKGIVAQLPESANHGDIYTVGNANYIYNNNITEGSKWVALGTVGKKILDFEASLNSINGQLPALGDHIEAVEAKADELNDVVGYIGKVDALPASANVGDVCIFNDKIYTWIAAVGSTAAHWEELGNESARIEALKARVEVVAALAGDTSAIEGIQGRLTVVEGAVNDPATGLAATKAIADEAKGKADTAVQTADFNTFKEQNTEAIADAKKAGTDVKEAFEAYKTSNDKAIDGIKNGTELNSFAAVETRLGSYATKTDLATEKAAILGDETSVSGGATVSGANKAAAAAATAAGEAKGLAQQGINDASDALKEAQKKVDAAYVTGALAPYATTEAVNGQFTDLKGGSTKTLKQLEDDISGVNTTATNAADAAVTAQGTANDAAQAAKEAKELAESKATLQEVKDLGYATTQQVADAAAAVRGVTTETVASVDAKVSTLSGTVTTHGTDIDSLKTVAGKAILKDGTVAMAANLDLGNNKIVNVKAPEADTDAANKKYVDDAKAAILGGAEAGVTVNSVNTQASNNAAAITDINTAIGDLRDAIESEFQAADAMVYMGTVASEADLDAKAATAEIGHTYKATAEFVMGEGDNAYPVFIGDLFIARGTENAETGIIESGLQWDHVSAGYRVDYVPTLEDVVAGNNIATVNLTSAHAAENTVGDLGSFSVSADTSSSVTVVAEANNIKIGMAWGEF